MMTDELPDLLADPNVDIATVLAELREENDLKAEACHLAIEADFDSRREAVTSGADATAVEIDVRIVEVLFNDDNRVVSNCCEAVPVRRGTEWVCTACDRVVLA